MKFVRLADNVKVKAVVSAAVVKGEGGLCSCKERKMRTCISGVDTSVEAPKEACAGSVS